MTGVIFSVSHNAAMKTIFTLMLLCLCRPALSQLELKTPFEKGDGQQSATYQQAIAFYQQLAKASPRVRIDQAGLTDSGKPLHVVLLSADGQFKLKSPRQRSVLLINNGIHPGETDGIDASMAFARDLSMATGEVQEQLRHVLVAIIPVYNIGGALNRNSGTRANQNGPREYGFRGNARNFDLNRDFMKCDTRNAASFAKIFHQLDPDLLIDTHVSNGADYQHVMTTAHSQKDKLGGELGQFLQSTFEPAIFGDMESSGFPTVPYVNSGGSTPENGFPQFLDNPRYSTGYAALFQTMGFMTETHMLKPYPKRVAATRAFLNSALKRLAEHGSQIRKLREQDRSAYRNNDQVSLSWKLNRDKPSRLTFLGYEASRIASKVTPGNRLFYDRTKPFTREIPFYNTYEPDAVVSLPAGYLIPAGWHSVIQLMKQNGIKTVEVQEETTVNIQRYSIDTVQTSTSPYEGHFYHRTLQTSVTSSDDVAKPGDVFIPINQPRIRYVVEALEPQATDSLFRWNYFDTILQRKEHFSPYVFEESAAELLSNQPELQSAFDAKIKDDSDFAASRSRQLQWLYERSDHAEKAYRQYPIVRLSRVPAEWQASSNRD